MDTRNTRNFFLSAHIHVAAGQNAHLGQILHHTEVNGTFAMNFNEARISPPGTLVLGRKCHPSVPTSTPQPQGEAVCQISDMIRPWPPCIYKCYGRLTPVVSFQSSRKDVLQSISPRLSICTLFCIYAFLFT